MARAKTAQIKPKKSKKTEQPLPLPEPEPNHNKTSNPIRREILIGVIAAIFVTIIFEPLIKWLWSLAIIISNNTYTGLISIFYRQAALGINDHVAVEIEFLLLTSFFGFGAMLGIIVLMRRKMKSDIPDDNKPSFFQSKYRIIKWIDSPIMIISFMCVGLLAFGVVLSNDYISLQLNATFNQRLTILAPVISDQQCRELKASWAIMKNRQDYESIINETQSLAAQNGIELPPPLLP
jgi:hypothetical protein